MLSRIHKLPLVITLSAIVAALSTVGIMYAADHGDTPLLMSIGRHDARLAGLHAFLRGNHLVISLTTDPTAPTIQPDVDEYIFPTDVTFRIFIDIDSEVTFDRPVDLAKFGGTIVRPRRIREDIVFTITFDNNNEPQLRSNSPALRDGTLLFTGLRDDPFIRFPRIGRNIAAMVLEMPLADVLDVQDTLLIWATASVAGLAGRVQEHAGRALRSQFPENDQMNTLHPKNHLRELDKAPDVIIFDTLLPAAFPNGRELTDDVVDLVGDPRVLANDGPPFPKKNDVRFLDVFPYLAPPQ